jgi:integrase/recombinase XerD
MAKKRLPKYLKVEAIERMMKIGIPSGYNVERNRVLIWMLYTTGLRLSEIEKINIEDVVEDGEVVQSFFLVGKGDKERIIRLPQETRKLIKEYLGDRVYDYGPLFIHSGGKRLKARSIRGLIKRIGERANITIQSEHGRKTPTTHTFRHSFAVNLLNNGVDIVRIQQLLGHSNLNTTRVYTQLSDKDLDETLDEVEWGSPR